MRALVSRSGLGSRSRGLLLPSSVVCAALIFGPVGTAVAVTDTSRDAYAYASIDADTTWWSSAPSPLSMSSTPSIPSALSMSSVPFTPSVPSTPSVPFTSSVPSASSSYADRVLKRLGALERADRNDVLAPVLNVLTDLTEQTGTGRLTATQAAGFATAVETAKASLKQRLTAQAGTTNRAAAVMADPISDLLDQLSATLNGLLDTVTGLVGGLLDTLNDLLEGLLDGLPPLPVELPPVTLPPVTLPPVTLPPLELPPVELPPVTLPALELPPAALPALPELPAAGSVAGTETTTDTVR